MPRDLVVGNGSLLINIDRNLNIRDLYYPHVGLFNHVGGHRNRVGVWVGGQFAWIEDTWAIRLGYIPGTLTTDVHASNGRLGIGLRFNDTVHPKLNLFLRRVTVENLHPEEREIRLFFGHDFRIGESDIGDTAFFHPFTGSMVHYKRDCCLMINGRTGTEGIFEYAAGVKEFGGAEGTWRDAEDGSLSMHPIEQGSVDSTVSFRLAVPANGTAALDYWIAVGRTLEEVEDLNAIAIGTPFETLFRESANRWKSWLDKKTPLDAPVPQSVAELYERSLLLLMTQTDRCGGILAANDTDIMQTARAHYSYVWPRDGAFAARALDLAGYGNPARRFFSFCAGILPRKHPYFLQKYSPDGSVGAAWHPWITDNGMEVPCQQDSTALVLWAVRKHYDRWRDKQFTEPIYRDLVVPAADYMIGDIDEQTSLPRPSYDLWEQRRGVHLFTCCAVYAALSGAARLARVFDRGSAEKYSEARDRLKAAITDRFFDSERGRFMRGLTGPDLTQDPTIDASMTALFLFELLPPDDPRVVFTMEAVYDRLWVRSPVGGLARYEDDYYFQASNDVRRIPGNPWFVSTLWMAEWYIAVARNCRDLEPAMDLIRWSARHASEAGLLPEQVHPFTGQPLAVMPLTWSHAAFVTTIMEYETKVQELAKRKADRA